MKMHTILSSVVVMSLVLIPSAQGSSNKDAQVASAVKTAGTDTNPAVVSSMKTENGVAGSYLSGRFARSSGDKTLAIDRLIAVHEKFPADMDVAAQLQGLLLLEGQFDKALEVAAQINNSNKKDSLAGLTLVLAAMKNGDSEQAADILQNSRQKGTVQLWIPLLAGWVDVSRHTLLKPITVEGLGVEVGRALPLVNYHLALINAQAGFKDAAAQNFKGSIEDPVNPPARIMQELLKFYDHNDSPDVLTSIVKTYTAAHPGTESESHAPVITTPVDGIAEVLYTMGGIMYGAGVVSDAAIYLQLAAYIKPDMDEAIIALADCYGDLKEYDQAAATYERVAAKSPLYLRAQMSLAVNYERMGKLPEALKRLDTMNNAHPDLADIWITKADLLRVHLRFPEAANAYTQALKREPKNGDMRWAILFARASCLDRMGRWPDAQKDLLAALALKTDQPDVLNYLGFAGLEHGDSVQKASQMIAKAIEQRPDDPQIIDSMGWALYLQGKYDDATKYLEKAVELMPGDAEVNDHLGDLYWRSGRKDEARFQWQRALSFSPEEKLAVNLHKKIKNGLPPARAQAVTSAQLKTSKPIMTATP